VIERRHSEIFRVSLLITPVLLQSPDLFSNQVTSVPSLVLKRRPDVVSAERKVAVAFYLTAQAKAARLPKFPLTTSISRASNSLTNILDPANLGWKTVSSLLAPIFDGGKRKLDVKIANEEQKQTWLSYAKVALVA